MAELKIQNSEYWSEGFVVHEPIRPVINNTHVPSYKAAKHHNKILNNIIELPFTYTTKNSNEVAQELNNIHIISHHKMTTLDIKDLYVKQPIQNIINIIKFWLNKKNNETTIIKQTLNLIKVILNQNYFNTTINIFNPLRA